MEEIVSKVVDQVCEEGEDNESKNEVEKEEKEVEVEGRFEEVNGKQKEEEENKEVEEEGEIFEEEEEEKLEDEEKLEEVKDGKKEEEEHNEEKEDEEECEEIEIKREENVEDEKYDEEEKEEEENEENNLEIEEEEEETMEQVKEDDYSSRKSSSGERQSFKIMEFIDFDEIKKEQQEDVEEIEQKASTNLLTQNVPQVTTNTLTQSNGGVFNSSISQQRPKRNRARRLYTPSPPPRFGGESKRKRESDDSLASTSLQTSSNPKKISWAKEQPRQVHSANKPQQQQPDHPTLHPPLPSQFSSSQQQNIDSTVLNSSASLSSSSHFASHPPPIVKFGHSIPPPLTKPPSTFGYSNQQTQMQTVQQAQHVVVLLRQNEKLAKEVASLKRLNQEQQQQIQSLISANRELIWAFNESRREHEELMKQLKTLMASNSNKNINNNSNGNVGQQQIGSNNSNFNVASNQQQKQQQQVVPKMEVIVPRHILSKTSTNTNKSSSDLQRSEKKLQQSNEISSYQPSVYAFSKPKKAKVVHNNSKTTLRTSAKSQQQPPKQPQQQQQKPQLFSNVPSSEQKCLVNLSSVEVKKEREDVGEIINRILPQNVEQKKRTKEEEIESIKDELNILKSNPDSSKFLGQRRPAFFTPKEFGDWHSVVSGDLRKQFVLKIFQALCPEVTQKCIDDYNKAYPSRVDYIKKSVNFSFETENDLFINSKSKELYIGLIAEKILHYVKLFHVFLQQQQQQLQVVVLLIVMMKGVILVEIIMEILKENWQMF
uniref:Uncharacterized protein n=1 Tax=Meloidogyne enterolobii TaxID=390850 RepID=A0A6V7UYW5_MELEN|nr:unnamed protein product [Meloidogyne enterolobii]